MVRGVLPDALTRPNGPRSRCLDAMSPPPEIQDHVPRFRVVWRGSFMIDGLSFFYFIKRREHRISNARATRVSEFLTEARRQSRLISRAAPGCRAAILRGAFPFSILSQQDVAKEKLFVDRAYRRPVLRRSEKKRSRRNAATPGPFQDVLCFKIEKGLAFGKTASEGAATPNSGKEVCARSETGFFAKRDR